LPIFAISLEADTLNVYLYFTSSSFILKAHHYRRVRGRSCQTSPPLHTSVVRPSGTTDWRNRRRAIRRQSALHSPAAHGRSMLRRVISEGCCRIVDAASRSPRLLQIVHTGSALYHQFLRHYRIFDSQNARCDKSQPVSKISASRSSSNACHLPAAIAQHEYRNESTAARRSHASAPLSYISNARYYHAR